MLSFDTMKIKELDLEIIQPNSKSYKKESQGGSKTVVIGKPGCFTKGTKILMYDGTFKNVEDVIVGDVVMGDDSSPRNVIELCRNNDTMFDIIPNKGEKYTVNKNHKLVLKSSGTAKYKKGQILEFSVDEFLKLNKTTQNRLKIFKNPIQFKEKDIILNPYFLGIWLGDGTSSSPEITTADEEILNFTKDTYKDHELTNKHKYRYYIKYTKGNSKTPNPIKEGLKYYNLLNNKHIPHVFKCNSREVRLQVLAGLIDTDGSYDDRSYCFDFKNKNEQLVDDLIFIARSLGFCAYKKECKKFCIYKGEKKEGTYYRTCISGDIKQIPTKIKRKQARERNHNKDVLVRGFEVVNVGEGDYYGFTLDGNHRFLLSTCDVVRNTGKSSLIKSLLYHKKHIFPIGIVMSGSEDSNGYYKKIFPSSFVYNKYDEEAIKKFVKRQKMVKNMKLDNPWGLLLLDDCTDDPKLFNKPLQHALYKKGRHWKMWYILSLQYAMDVKPVIRVNVDGTFILREPSVKIRRIIWENYAGIIPDFTIFCSIMDKLTDDYTALYIHNATTSNKIQDCIFWYKANLDKIPETFKFGSNDFWDFHDERYNKDYKEEFLDT